MCRCMGILHCYKLIIWSQEKYNTWHVHMAVVFFIYCGYVISYQTIHELRLTIFFTVASLEHWQWSNHDWYVWKRLLPNDINTQRLDISEVIRHSMQIRWKIEAEIKWPSFCWRDFKSNFLNENCGIVHWWMSTRFKLTIIQHWFRKWFSGNQTISHYMSQWWLDSLTHMCVTRPPWDKWCVYVHNTNVAILTGRI